tara:strand:+ start:117 stop:482 length:366 start_codon:yes stop_codon:yes gene_type:complete
MIWNNIIDWFNHQAEKDDQIRIFNDNAKKAFINGDFPTLLKAKKSWGNRNYKHAFSDFRSGFRITASNKHSISIDQCKIIGTIIMGNQKLVRTLIACGFDTLEVFGMEGDGFQTGLNLLLE